VVSHLSFTVNAGDYLCIIGENGSGKTTLMRTLLKLIEPISGTIETGEGLSAREIGYLPQKTAVQSDFPASVQEIVLSGCLGHSRGFFYTKEEKELAEQNMERAGILNLKNRCFRELSGGLQQRTLLARALCASGRILLLDEPVSGLDPQAMEDMYALLNRLNREGMTIMMISHDLGQAMNAASHVLRIGDPLFFGTKEEYLNSGVLKPGREENHD
jgi:zinc transport system ATP-binding protein